MTNQQNDPFLQDLIATLEACRERMQSIQQEAERSMMLLNLALGSVGHARSHAVTRDGLQALLDEHHARLAKTLERGAPSDAADFDPHRLVVDVESRTARVGRRHVPLTEAEYKVLELLWTRGPNIVSRRMLLDHLYGDGDQPGEEVLDVFIFHVRQKLRNAGCAGATVESVRGRGWYLDLRQPGEAARAQGAESAPA